MKKSERSPYSRLATDEDKQIWLSVYAPMALVGFVQVTESGVTHWAAVVRNRGIRNGHVRYGLCNSSVNAKATPTIEVNCMTCIVRAAQGPRVR
jgi:ribosomal protein RSM22 (predicted rRNA methylase)